MRSAIVAAAFAIGALAVPYNEKRSYAPAPPPENNNPDVDVVYVTNVVTVMANGPAPASTPAPAPKHHGYKHKHHKQPKPAPAPAPAPPSYLPPQPAPAPQPAPQAPAPQPEPETSKSSQSSSDLPPAPGDSYKDKCLWHHNVHRMNHSAPMLVWDDELAELAQQLADTCNYAHNVELGGGGYGQNIAAGVEPGNISAVITELFYGPEAELYKQAGNYNPNTFNMNGFEGWGHFTQMMWCDTTHVGCATSRGCSSLTNCGSDVAPYFTVCNYKNPGNYAGQYAKNVHPPKGMAPISWNSS